MVHIRLVALALVLVQILLLVGGGCGILGKVPPRPSYDDGCNPTPLTFVELARSGRNLVPLREISPDPETAYDQALAEVGRLGWHLQVKPVTGNEQVDGFSTTLPGVILLEHDWEHKPFDVRAAALWHEVVHVRQYKRQGADVFLATYLTVPEGRWAFEVQAYAMSFRLMVHFGETPERVLRAMEDGAVALHDEYQLSAMPECTQSTAVQIWQASIADLVANDGDYALAMAACG